jgi:glycosyltransferase involved in cell wall biosynthesis
MRRICRLVLSPFQFAMMLIRERPDVIHINTSLVPRAYWRDIVYLVIARSFRKEIVTQIHGGALPQSFFDRPFLRWVLKKFLRASHVVVVLSSEEVRAYRTFDERVRVELVPNAIAVTEAMTNHRESNVDAPLQIVYVGRLVRTKGVFDALVAARQLKDEAVPFRFQIAGSGPDEMEVRREILRLGLGTDVLMLGPIAGDAKTTLWLTSDVFAFPTFHLEGLPYTILEALAAGCVPVTCAVAAIPDVMRNGQHGIFIPPHDPAAIAAAIRRLAENRDELRQMSDAGRRRVAEQYTVDRLVAQFREIYAGMV